MSAVAWPLVSANTNCCGNVFTLSAAGTRSNSRSYYTYFDVSSSGKFGQVYGRRQQYEEIELYRVLRKPFYVFVGYFNSVRHNFAVPFFVVAFSGVYLHGGRTFDEAAPGL
jgi:hypothetical protein